MENVEDVPGAVSIARPRGVEKDMVRGHASQLANLNVYCVAVPVVIMAMYTSVMLVPPGRYACFAAAGLVAVWALWRYLVIRMYRFHVTTERLYLRRGVLNIRTDQLELYRVKDVTVMEPLMYRIFGHGNVVLHSSDRSMPTLVLFAIKTPHQLGQTVRTAVENARFQTGVREID